MFFFGGGSLLKNPFLSVLWVFTLDYSMVYNNQKHYLQITYRNHPEPWKIEYGNSPPLVTTPQELAN